MQDYQVINGEIYPKTDPIPKADLLAQRGSLVAARDKSTQDAAGFQAQIDSIDVVLNQIH